MGEIFAAESPPVPLEFTGERMTSAARGQIEYEHLHRYCFARLLCRGKDVVDVASGEGYGTALLAQVARSVVGIDFAADAVRHAAGAYRRPNCRCPAIAPMSSYRSRRSSIFTSRSGSLPKFAGYCARMASW